MAKSDSFFIRASVITSNVGFNQTTIDLGAYVDALGKSVLRIHNVQVQYRDAAVASSPIVSNGAGTHAEACWQLTTQSANQIYHADNRSVISSGMCEAAEQSTGQATFEASDINLQEWTNGYLIGVESLHLGGEQSGLVADAKISIVMECTVETLSQAAAMALSLSQQ